MNKVEVLVGQFRRTYTNAAASNDGAAVSLYDIILIGSGTNEKDILYYIIGYNVICSVM